MKVYHYVYRITNIMNNKSYIGARTSNVESQKDLGIIYYSSSTDASFIEDQKNNPHYYKYEIIAEVDSRHKAIQLEIKLHNEFNVGVNESFYNKAKQTSTKFDTTGTKHSDETINKMKEWHKLRPPMGEEQRLKISESNKGKRLTPEHIQKLKDAKQNISEETIKKMRDSHLGQIPWNKGKKLGEGKKHSEESKVKMSNAKIGKPRSEETKRKISEALKKRKKS